jgi:glycosyltransferase involved in cell wall biosynthesis
VPWFPEKWELNLLRAIPGLKSEAERVSRRRFEPLAEVPKVQGRVAEWSRMVRRKLGGGEELSYEANDWLMRTMVREMAHRSVKAVHSYEDCGQWQFQDAKRRGKACIYDMPIGYYGWWQKKEAELAKKYRDWLPSEGISSSQWVRPEQKKKEMELADVVLAPSSFVVETIRDFFDKRVVLAPYGADPVAFLPHSEPNQDRPFRVLFVGTASVRKGIPFLLEVWKKLGWKDAELVMAGSWQLAEAFKKNLPNGVRYLGQLSKKELKSLYQTSDFLVHPSNFEGFSLSILEALAEGLPVLASTATGAGDLPRSQAVQLFEPEDPEQLAEVLICAKSKRGNDLTQEARRIAVGCSWKAYREKVKEAVRPFV